MIERKSVKDLFDELNDTDESECLEAKSIRYDTSRSLLETICSFSNEPNLGGGVIVLGVAERDTIDGLRCDAEDIADLDKRQLVLSDGQKMALVFLREVGAIDNNAYRQLTGLDTLHASYELRGLRDLTLIEQRGKGQRTYYRTGTMFPPLRLQDTSSNSQDRDGSLADKDGSLVDKGGSLADKNPKIQAICMGLPKRLSPDRLSEIIVQLCGIQMLSANELATHLDRNPRYLMHVLVKMVKAGLLSYRFPMMPNHPEQAYGVKGKTL